LIASALTVADVRAAADAEQAATVDLLRELVAAPTTLGNEEPGQRLLADAFAAADLDVVDVPLDAEALRAHPHAALFDWEVEGKRNLVARWRPGPVARGGRSLILGGHVDVVSAEPADLWRTAPFEPVLDGEGWLYGRGACDMKSGLAAMVGAVRVLRRLGIRPAAPLALHSVVEEEVGGNGALACALAGHASADGCVLVEPTGGVVCTAQVGLLWFDVRLVGTASHTAERDRGVSALDLLPAARAALAGVEDALNRDAAPPFDGRPVFVNVGVVRAGTMPSIVAPDCVLSCRVSLLPGHDVATVRRLVEDAVAAIEAPQPPGVTWRGFVAPAYVLATREPLVGAARAALRAATGSEAEPEVTAVLGAADARTYGFAGSTPTVLMGARGERMHAPDERVWLPSVVETVTALVLLVRDWCGVVEETR
jgi:acetylornithine deacetylase